MDRIFQQYRRQLGITETECVDLARRLRRTVRHSYRKRLTNVQVDGLVLASLFTKIPGTRPVNVLKRNCVKKSIISQQYKNTVTSRSRAAYIKGRR